MNAHDWEATPLGSPPDWPVALRVVVNLMLDSPESIFVAWGPKLTFLFNDAFAPLLGSRLSGSMGLPLRQLWFDAWAQIKPVIEKAMAGEASRFENMPLMLSRGGLDEQTWWTFSYSPLRDESGAITGLFCVANETTSQVRADRRTDFVIKLQDRLNDLTEPRAIMTSAAEFIGTHLMVGRAGYGETDSSGRFFTIECEWTDSAMPALIKRVQLDEYGSTVITELRAGRTVRLDDTNADMRTSGAESAYEQAGAIRAFIAVPLIKQGRLVAAFFVHHAVPRQWTDDDEALVLGVAERTWSALERARADEALRELNETLETRIAERSAERDRLWTLSADMLVRADFHGMMSAVSPAWERVLGWKEEELLARAYASIIHPDDMPKTLSALSRMRVDGQPARFENRIATADGKFKPIEWTVVAESDGINFIAVGRDLTANKIREAEMRALEEALRQSQKMEAVGQLTGGLAHDFNNLLTGISGSLELLQTRTAQGRYSDVDRYVLAAQGASKRAAALTHRLLAFSRRQTLDPRTTNINALIAGMEELIRRTMGPEIHVETVAAGGMWNVNVDPNQLENALLNLAINARDAMPNGGKLTIETANRWLDERAARERELPPGQYVSMCVSDNGVGMRPEIVAKAFDPFFTTKPIGVGTGLGLSMIYGFARQSGGQVRIYSEPDEGTMVCIYVPRDVRNTDEGSSGVIVSDVVHAELGETVLIVDDEPLVRMLVVDMLPDFGYASIEAQDGAAALKILRSNARIDLLITDVGLPNGMNGRQVADAARELRPDLKVLFITGYAENAVLNHGHLNYGMHVMTKPFEIAELGRRIRSIISGN